MKLIRKYLLEVISFPLLLIAFFATRLTNLMSLPIFTDEAIYTRWAQIAKQDSNWRFISLTDGKQPSFIWAESFMMKFVEDSLLSGRLVSVFSGLLVCVGIYFLTREIFSKEKNVRWISISALIFTVFFPFLLVYDRLAIYESMTAAFFVWALYLQVLLVRRLRLDVAMILGFVLGGAVLTKSSGFLSIYLTPFLLILIDLSKKTIKSKIIKFGLLAVVSACIAYAMYSIQRLSPFFHIIDQKNSIFVHPVSEWLSFPIKLKLEIIESNFRGLSNWFFIYFNPINMVLVIASFVIFRRYLKEKALLLIWFVLPFIALCVFGKTLYPRYILFMVLPLIPLVAYAVVKIFEKYKNYVLRACLILTISAVPIWMINSIIFNFQNSPIPRSDLEQFINGWPSGGGVKESVEFFKNESKKGPIFIATQGTFGLMPYSYEIYLDSNENVTVKGYWPTNDLIPEDVLEVAKNMPTYFVFYQDCHVCETTAVAPKTWPLELIQSYKKGTGKTKLNIYKVIPVKE